MQLGMGKNLAYDSYASWNKNTAINKALQKKFNSSFTLVLYVGQGKTCYLQQVFTYNGMN